MAILLRVPELVRYLGATQCPLYNIMVAKSSQELFVVARTGVLFPDL